jgi:4-hydroxy-2-oxoheptanedioate aldolase
MGPGDLGLSLSAMSRSRAIPIHRRCSRRERVFAACRKHHIAFLETATPESIIAKLNEWFRVITGHPEETAIIGRAHQKRAMPV